MSNNLDRFKLPRTKSMPAGQVDLARVDATTDAQIRQQKRSDTLEAKADAAAYVRGIRERLGFSQPEFAVRINLDPAVTLSSRADLADAKAAGGG